MNHKAMWVETASCGMHYFNVKDDKMIEMLPDQWMCSQCTQGFDLRSGIQLKPVLTIEREKE